MNYETSKTFHTCNGTDTHTHTHTYIDIPWTSRSHSSHLVEMLKKLILNKSRHSDT